MNDDTEEQPGSEEETWEEKEGDDCLALIMKLGCSTDPRTQLVLSARRVKM